MHYYLYHCNDKNKLTIPSTLLEQQPEDSRRLGIFFTESVLLKSFVYAHYIRISDR